MEIWKKVEKRIISVRSLTLNLTEAPNGRRKVKC
jgi:hypothetical protein